MKTLADIHDPIDSKRAAEIIGISYEHVTRLANEGTLDGAKEGRDWRISEQSAREFAAIVKTTGRPRGRKTCRV